MSNDALVTVWPRCYFKKSFKNPVWPEQPLTVISIYSTPDEWIVAPRAGEYSFPERKLPHVLSLCFADITPNDEKAIKAGYTLFNEDLADQIVTFVERYKDSEAWLVHCDAGISRSGAIGLWITRRLQLNEEYFWQRHPCIRPNYWILSLLPSQLQAASG
jgi:predicted protein tyrosine phosphatase